MSEELTISADFCFFESKEIRTMAYEKPELITLSLTGTAVRNVSQDAGSQESQDAKMWCILEYGGYRDSNQMNDTVTSSSSGAYEADE